MVGGRQAGVKGGKRKRGSCRGEQPQPASLHPSPRGGRPAIRHRLVLLVDSYPNTRIMATLPFRCGRLGRPVRRTTRHVHPPRREVRGETSSEASPSSPPKEEGVKNGDDEGV